MDDPKLKEILDAARTRATNLEERLKAEKQLIKGIEGYLALEIQEEQA